MYITTISDKQKPKLLKCPDENIIKKTSKTEERVIWTEPIYSDNCGNSSECQIDIYTPTPPNSVFQQGSTTPVSYKATDPSGNSNEECIFNVIIKGTFKKFFYKARSATSHQNNGLNKFIFIV